MKKNKSFSLMMLVLMVIILLSCTSQQSGNTQVQNTEGQQQYTPEKYFKIKKTDDGKGIEIIEYTGKDTIVNIPPIIQGLPVTNIGRGAFEGGKKKVGKRLTSVTIPNSVISIGEAAFIYNKLSSITIPNSVISIGKWAFSDNQLSSITIPNSVISIGKWAFESNQLSSVTIPNKVNFIGIGAFYNSMLMEINCAMDNPVFTTIEGVLFSKDLKTIVVYPAKKGNEYIIPKGVTVIADYAFYGSKLIRVNIPEGVSTIGKGAFQLNELTNVNIPNSVTTIGDRAFAKNHFENIPTLSKNISVSMSAFEDNTPLSVKDKNSIIDNEYKLAIAGLNNNDFPAAMFHYRNILALSQNYQSLKIVWDSYIKKNNNLYPAPFEGEWKYVISQATTITKQVQVEDLGRALGLGRAYGYRTETRTVQVQEKNIILVFNGNNYNMKYSNGERSTGTFLYSNEKLDLGNGEILEIKGYPIIIELENGLILGFDGSKIIFVGENIIMQR